MILNYTPRYINYVPLTFSLVYEHSYEKHIQGNHHYFKKIGSAKYCSLPLCYVGLNLIHPL